MVAPFSFHLQQLQWSEDERSGSVEMENKKSRDPTGEKVFMGLTSSPVAAAPRGSRSMQPSHFEYSTNSYICIVSLNKKLKRNCTLEVTEWWCWVAKSTLGVGEVMEIRKTAACWYYI